MPAEILFISYDGMTDPLGQSQVIPYLAGLSEMGYRISILSCEKKKNFAEKKTIIDSLLRESNIHWHPVRYWVNPSVIGPFLNLLRLRRTAFSLSERKEFKIVHCRSYIPSLIGMEMKKRLGTKFIFDMRGFWADERSEGGLWNLKNPLYKWIYNFFKNRERKFLLHADSIISLTKSAISEINNWNLSGNPLPFEHIPCCVDLDLFSMNTDARSKTELQKQLKISEKDFVLTYLGALGTWYLLDEMLLFFKGFLEKKPDSKFLFITAEPADSIHSRAVALNIESGKIIVKRANRNEVPVLLGLSNLGIFFYKNGFSRKACSPTKLGEMLAAGLPVICNSGIGDTDEIISESKCGIIIRNVNPAGFTAAVSVLDSLLEVPREKIRSAAIKYFSLSQGIELYHKVYQKCQVWI